MQLNSVDIIQYMNIVFIALIVLFGLIGFFRGTLKSLYYLVATIIVFVGGWFLMKPVTNVMLTYDLSSRGLMYNDIPFNNANQFITDFIVEKFSLNQAIITEDTMTSALILGLVSLILKFAYLVILVVLAFTIFKLIFDIIWFAIKPRKKVVNGQKVKRTKGLSSRLGGLGIGAVKGCFYALLLFFSVAGIASIANSIDEAMSEQEDISYNILLVENTITVVESPNNENLLPDELTEVLEILGAYKNSVPGKVFNTFTFNNSSIDEVLFDQVFSLDVDKHKIKLRSELEIALDVFNRINAKLPDNIPLSEGLTNLAIDDPDSFKEIVEELSTLKLVNIFVPVGIELALLLEDENGQTIFDQLPQDTEIDWKALKDINYETDIKRLGYVFVDVLSLSPTEGKGVDFLNLNPETVDKIFDNFSDLEILDIIAPIAITYLFTLESLDNSLQQLNMSLDDLGFAKVEDWGEEVKQIGTIYRAFSELNISSFTPEGLEVVTGEAVNNFSEAIFDSIILKNAVPVIVQSVTGIYMPDEYREIIVLDNVTWDQNEFSAIINASIVLIKTDILSGTIESLVNLKDEDIDDLSNYLSESRFITNNLNNIIKIIFENLEVFDEQVKVVTISNNEWISEELQSIFKVVQIIASEDITNLGNLTEEKIYDLSYHLANSKFITSNIDPILNTAINSINFSENVTIGKFDHWNNPDAAERELIAVLQSIKIVSDKGNDIDSFINLNDDELDIILDSEIISKTLINLLEVYSQPGGQLDFLVGVDNNDINWLDSNYQSVDANIIGLDLIIKPAPLTTRYNIYLDDVKVDSVNNIIYHLDDVLGDYEIEGYTEGELRKLFRALSILIDSAENDFDVNVITSLDDKEIEQVLTSEILALTIIDQVEQLANDPEAVIKIPEGPLKSNDDWVKLNAWKNHYRLTEDDIYSYNDNGDLVYIKGELAKLVDGLNLLLSDVTSLDNITFDITPFIESADEILKSAVILETAIENLVSLDQIDIPTGSGYGLNDPYNRSAWANIYEKYADGDYVYDESGNVQVSKKGELVRLLEALDIIIEEDPVTGERNFNNINFSIESLFDQHNQDIFLSSLVVSETAVNMVYDVSKDNSFLHIPSAFYVNALDDESEYNRNLWFNDYDENTKGELANLINAAEIVLDGDNFENINFDLSVAFKDNNREIILKSKVFSETLVNMVFEEANKINSIIRIPSYIYVNELTEDDRDKWFNEYEDDIITFKGELAYLIDAAEIILDGNAFDNVQFDLTKAHAEQDTILKSKVFSETLVNMVFDEAAKGVIYIPEPRYVERLIDIEREKWFNDYENDTKGELAYLLNAANLLTSSSGTGFTNIDFEVDVLFDKNTQEDILKSTVFSETIVRKILAKNSEEEQFMILPTEDLDGNLFEDPTRDRAAWFNQYTDEQVLREGELAKFLDGIALIAQGSTFNDLDKISIDKILEVNLNIIHDPITLDLVESDVEVMLESLIIEATLAPITKDIATVVMIDYLVAPSGGYNWYRRDIFDQEEYDLQSFIESIYLLNQSGINYNELSTFSFTLALDTEGIAKAMVVSRTFKGSIAKMFNKIIGLEGFFNQERYNGTRIEAYENLVEDLDFLSI